METIDKLTEIVSKPLEVGKEYTISDGSKIKLENFVKVGNFDYLQRFVVQVDKSMFLIEVRKV